MELSERSKTASNLPKLRSSSLLAVGSLCDDRKNIKFDQNKVHAIEYNDNVKQLVKESNILLQGNRNPFDGCWDIPIAKTKPQFGNHPLPENHS